MQQSTTASSSPSIDLFRTDLQLHSHHQEAQYDGNNNSLNASAAYYPPTDHLRPESTTLGGFDLNAVGDEDDDGDDDGQVDTYNQDTSEGQGDGNDGMNEQDDVDRRSVYVGNVDYGTTPPELQEHFKNCGAINRITIMVDKFTGHPKGYAYIEFQDPSAIPNAVSLNDTTFRERQLKVTAKRKNVPGYAPSRGGRGGLLRGGHMRRGGGMFRGGFRGRGRGMRRATGYFPRYRGRGGRGVSPY